MSRGGNCAMFEDDTQEEFCTTSIHHVLQEFSTKKTSTTPIFAYGHHQDLRMVGEQSFWKLCVYPLEVKEREDVKTNYLGCFMSLEMSQFEVQIEGTITFGVQSPAGDSLMTLAPFTHNFGQHDMKQAFGYPYAFSHKEIEETMLFVDKLHIHVDIRYKIISGGTAVKRLTSAAIFLNLFQKQSNIRDTGDILLFSSDAKELRAHKFILSMHSTVFAAMFEHPLKEYATGRCVIEDLDGETIGAMLSYMYGKAEWNPEMAEKLVVAANKYKIDPLEKACVEELIKQLNLVNCLAFLSIADKHSLELLKVKTLDFIASKYGMRLCFERIDAAA